MKALFVNGGPRKQWSTFKMLESAMKGAESAGAETEMIHLYDVHFNGCMSCLACKMKNAKTNGVCAIKDNLRSVLEKAHDADVIVIGSPIYFSDVTGVTRAFMERLMYPVLSYNPKTDEAGNLQMSLLGKTIPNAMIYTMGSTEEAGAAYEHFIEENKKFLQMLFGDSEVLCTYDTYMMNDYSRYDMMEGVEERRAKQRDEQFPKDLEAAYELGKRLVEKTSNYQY